MLKKSDTDMTVSFSLSLSDLTKPAVTECIIDTEVLASPNEEGVSIATGQINGCVESSRELRQSSPPIPLTIATRKVSVGTSSSSVPSVADPTRDVLREFRDEIEKVQNNRLCR